jgi:hypothetical protein
MRAATFWLLMIGLLLLAFGLRLHHLDTMPPGISGDESTNAVDGFLAGQAGKLPLYEDVGRPEHLHRVILAITSRLFGLSVWAFRVVSVFIGLLTVAAAWWAIRQCLADRPPLVQNVAGFAGAAALAVMMNHIVLSRAIYRALLIGPPTLLFAGFLARGLRTYRWRDFVLSGISLGVALHSYTAALVLPAAVPVVGLALLIFRFRAWRDWLPRLVVLGLVTGVIAAPAAYMLVTDSERVLARVSNVGGGLTSSNIEERTNRLIDEFFVQGDINSQYNANRAPLLPPGFSWLFRLGLLGLLVRVRQPSSPLIAALLVLATLPVLVAGEIPHGLRIAGEFAAVPLVIGMGVALILSVGELLAAPGRGRSRARLFPLLVLALLVGLTIDDARTVWADYRAWWQDNSHPWGVYGRKLQHGDWFFRTDHRDLGEWLSAQHDPLLVPVDAISPSTVRAWLLVAYPEVTATGDALDLPDGTRLVVPWALELGDLWRDSRQYALLHGDSITLLPPFTAETRRALLAGIDDAPAVMRANGDLLLRERPLPPNLTLAVEPVTAGTPADPLAIFDHRAALVGWRGPDTLDGRDPQTITITLDWSAQRPINHFYSAFVQLQTQDFVRLAGLDGPIWRWLYPPILWPRGGDVPVSYTFDVPGDLAPGAYRLVVGLYLGDFPGLRVPPSRTNGDAPDDMATVGWIKVPQMAMPAPDPNYTALDATLADTFRLRGVSLDRRDDGTLRVVLTWESMVERPPIDATVFVHALDASGTIVTQSDIRPWNGQYPTFIWGKGEIVQTEHILTPGDAHDLRLSAGMYTFPTLARLPVVQNGAPTDGDVVDLGRLP